MSSRQYSPERELDEWFSRGPSISASRLTSREAWVVLTDILGPTYLSRFHIFADDPGHMF